MRAAFAEIVDYAGLFPPASCSMADAIHQYDTYRHSPDRWMLGRFVVAASRLDEFGRTAGAQAIHVDPAEPWHLSAVMAVPVPNEVARIAAFHKGWQRRGFVVDAVEYKVTSVGQVMTLAEQIPDHFRRFFEVPAEGPYSDLVAAIGAAGGLAKVRTGGTVPGAFPEPPALVDFLAAVVAHNVAFKATAGLHHPYRGSYPLTYARDAERYPMYGFVGLLLAVAELIRTGDQATARLLLEETDSTAFQMDAEAISWRGRRYGVDELAAARARAFVGFGSCSFREPVDELGLGAPA